MIQSPDGRSLSGCKALEGCDRKSACQRYQRFLESTQYRSWSAHHQCRLSEFVENHYPFFIPTEKIT